MDPISVTCPGCQKRYTTPPSDKKRSFVCSVCQEVIVIPALAVAAAAGQERPPDVDDLQIPGYRIDKVLGHGGMGSVYLATQLSLSRPVAIKVLPEQLSDDAAYIARFLAEAHTTAKLQHDNIIRAIDRGNVKARYFLVMEYAAGETVAQRIARTNTLPEREVLSIARQVAEGLRHAALLGFIHCDIKPSNLIVSPDGRVKICDLGLTRAAQSDPGLTTSGRIVCSLAYASPEALRGGDLDARSDIYSLGATIYEMVTGRRPFTAKSRTAMARQQLQDPPELPRKLNPGLSEGLQRLILKMLAMEPSGRHKDYDELINDLDGLTGVRKQAPKKREIPKAAGNRKLQVGIIAGVMAVLAILAGIIHYTTRKQPAPPIPMSKRPTPAIETVRQAQPQPPQPDDTGKTLIEQKPDPDPTPKMVSKEYRDKLDLYIWTLNLSGVAAAYCDRMSKTKDATELRDNMRRVEQEMRDFVASLKEQGESPYLNDYIHATDTILFFDKTKLDGASKDHEARVLGQFVASVKAGSRARVCGIRNGETFEFDIRFDQRPKDLMAIVKVADLIPAGDPAIVLKEASVPAPKSVPPSIKNVADRTHLNTKTLLLEGWRQRDSDFARGIVLFLELPESTLDEEARSALAKHFEKYDPEKPLKAEQHAAAAKELFDSAKGFSEKPSGRMLDLIALGHLGEACRDGIAPGKAVAETRGLSLSADGKLWGTNENLALYKSKTSVDEAEKAVLSGSYPIVYVGADYLLRTVVKENSGHQKLYYLLIKAAKKGDAKSQEHLQSMAADLKEFSICKACTEGKISCPKCNGAGETKIPGCATCNGSGRIEARVGFMNSVSKVCTECGNRGGIKQHGGRKKCGDCSQTDHTVKCSPCKGTGWPEKIAGASMFLREKPCDACGSTGMRFRRVALACQKCMATGCVIIRFVPPRPVKPPKE
jgi:serine/threonine protein kinase